MRITIAEHTDLQNILELQYLAYQSEARLLNNFLIPPLTENLEDLERQLPNHTILKAVEKQGNIIGSVRGTMENGTLRIGKLMVHPAYQRQGLGCKLLAAIESLRPGLRCELFTSDKSTNNLRLYEKNGYVRFAEREISPGLKLIFLEKIQVAEIFSART